MYRYNQKVVYQVEDKIINGVITCSRKGNQYEVFGDGKRQWITSDNILKP